MEEGNKENGNTVFQKVTTLALKEKKKKSATDIRMTGDQTNKSVKRAAPQRSVIVPIC